METNNHANNKNFKWQKDRYLDRYHYLLLGQPSSKDLDPSGHISHFSPENPDLHWHLPVYSSHWPLSEPMTEQPQSKQPKLV